ncbi:MAG: hypothetical protein CBC53_001635 [Alphaproteobacteria bacterium TMED93]|nr:MAG: hypothetical protein CBC53_001635 [Alphaproteobacteria bacterium TMED93]
MIGKNLFHLTIIILFFNVNIYGQEAEVDPYGEVADIQAAKFKTPGSDCMEYLAEKGREQYKQMKVGATTVLFICGESEIKEPPSSRKFLISRMNGFDKAVLNGLENYSKFRSQIISEQVSYALNAGKDPNLVKSALEEREEVLNEEEKGIFDKLKDLANTKLDKKLKEEGIDPEADKEEALEAIAEIVESSSFNNVVEASSRVAISGIQTAKVWEVCKMGKPCRVAVLLARTPEQAGIANAMLAQSTGSLKGPPGKPLKTKWKVRDVLANVGTRIQRDENGDYHLITVSMHVPNKGGSLDTAYKFATNRGNGLMRRFAGTVISSSTKSAIQEVTNIDNLGNSENELNSYLDSLVESNAERAKIPGIAVIAQGPVIHPVNPEVNAVYTVLKWSFNSQKEALKPLEAAQPNSNNDANSPTTDASSNTSLESEEADF